MSEYRTAAGEVGDGAASTELGEGGLLFVCGFPGGGTDLLKTVLNAHPDVHLSGEMPFLQSIGEHGYDASSVFEEPEEVRRFQALLARLDTWSNLEGLGHDFADDLAEAGRLSLEDVLRRCFNARPARIWGNKTPQNTEAMDRLAQIFPSARFLVIVRDPRDVALSWRRKWGRHLPSCAARWAQRMARGLETGERLAPGRTHWCRFEDLLDEPAAVCRDICDFLGLPFSERMIEHHRHVESMIDGKINYGEPIRRENTGKWRQGLSVAEARRVEEICSPVMQGFGYEPSFATATRGLTGRERAWGRIHDLAAFVFVGNRASTENGWRARLGRVAHEVRKRVGP